MARRILLLVALLAAGCSQPAPNSPAVITQPPGALTDDGSIPPPRAVVRSFPEESFRRGVEYLLEQQSADGSWRSDVYATFKDGAAMTPFALGALLDAADAGLNPPESAAARKRAVAWLARFVKPDGTIDTGPDGFDYPIYTASLTLKALSHPENAEHRRARGTWVKYIKERQLSVKLGWKPEEKPFGGWGYCRVIPKKPEPGQFAPALLESNVSATVFALDALRTAGALDHETATAAEVFLLRCQNDDGGFHFIYDDPVRNKAGSPDPPGGPDVRFHSYGSTTADGLRGLSITEAIWHRPEDDAAKSMRVIRGSPTPRIKARLWLDKHFRADTHPGEYVKAHEPNREAVYYYFAASVAKALREMRVDKAGGMDRAVELAHELAKRQREDGSWANPVELVRENDPLVATANAVTALANCRR